MKTLTLWRCALLIAALGGASTAVAGRVETLDDRFFRVATQAPGFAGAYYADSGALTIAVKPGRKSLTSREASRSLSALTRVFGKGVLRPMPSSRRSQPRFGRVEYRLADYRFDDLYRWYARLRPVLKIRGVAYTDIDERRNRLVVGVSGGKPTAAIANYISASGIPFSSVLFEDSQELYYYYSGSIIGSEQRPALSGIELGTQAGGRCTIGFNVWFPDWWWSSPGFVTAGHCGTPGDLSADSFEQPEGGDVIAAEHNNPGFWSGGDCPTDGCRYSDSALVRYDNDVEFAGSASIIRTLNFNASVNVDESNQTIDIAGESPWLLSGDEVHKVGVGRGWTIGTIGDTCVDRAAPGDASRTFLCQYDANSLDTSPIACVGDSGAPVFFWHETIAPQAALAGILFAGTEAQCSSTYVFSPMLGIREDLGYFEIQ